MLFDPPQISNQISFRFYGLIVIEHVMRPCQLCFIHGSGFVFSLSPSIQSDKAMAQPKRAILIPGNGCDDLSDCMWYPWLADALRHHNIEIELRAFPDPLYAHEDIWKAFAVDQLMLDESTLLIGHSSGAACALRLMEEHNVFGCVLVAAYDDDLGDDLERESGYFSRPFRYDVMLTHCKRAGVVQFHSHSDHLVPVRIARRVAKGFQKATGSSDSQDIALPGGFSYIETHDDGHFQEDEYVEVMWPSIAQMCHLNEEKHDT